MNISQMSSKNNLYFQDSSAQFISNQNSHHNNLDFKSISRNNSIIGGSSKRMMTNPTPMRFTCHNSIERLMSIQQDNSRIDTMPADVDKHAFDLRKRQRDKELAHSTFRIKSFTTVDRLNNMY